MLPAQTDPVATMTPPQSFKDNSNSNTKIKTGIGAQPSIRVDTVQSTSTVLDNDDVDKTLPLLERHKIVRYIPQQNKNPPEQIDKRIPFLS